MRISKPSVKQISVSDRGISLQGELLEWVDHTVTLTRVMPDHDGGDPGMVTVPTFDYYRRWSREGFEGLKGRVCVVQDLAREVTHVFQVPAGRLAELHPYLDAIRLDEAAFAACLAL